jgi:hypothetical protein
MPTGVGSGWAGGGGRCHPPWPPRLLAEVRSDAHTASRFHVLVRLDAPLLGRLLTYGGYLDESDS